MEKTNTKSDITRLIRGAAKGDQDCLEELWPKIYKELRQIANFYFHRVNSQATLNPTSLVSELFLKLIGKESIEFADRAHFFAVAAKIMRDVLVDHARKTYAQKRGGRGVKLVFEEKMFAGDGDKDQPLQVIMVHELLQKLAEFEPDLAKVAELKYFAGMSTEEMAEALNVSEGTVKRRWNAARLWLYHEISEPKTRKAG